MSDNFSEDDHTGITVSPSVSGGEHLGGEALAVMQAAADRLRQKALENPITMLLRNQRKETTQRGYRLSLSAFFTYLGFGPNPSPAEVHAFVSLSPHHIALHLAGYRAHMLAEKLSSSTINTRLAPIRSLLKISLRLGYAQTSGRGLVDNEKVRAYRDTRGPLAETVQRIFALPDQETLKGKRDYAILRLLADNALRRAEVFALDVGDFDASEARAQILGKGHTEKEWVELSRQTVRAVLAYLIESGHGGDRAAPLFLSCDRRHGASGSRLTRDGLHDMIRTYGEKIGIRLTPHKFRHYAITALVKKTDIHGLMQFSRHARAETVMKYVDNAENQQGRLTRLLGEMHGD